MRQTSSRFSGPLRAGGLVGIQGAARELVHAATGSGMSEAQAHFFDDPDSASEFVCEVVESGDLLLIKGSRGVHTERIVKSLLATFEVLH